MSDRFKYPRTPHLPWSPGASGDDITLSDTSGFHQKIVVVTEKMDGENSSLYQDYMHARSVHSRHHPSRNWLKRFHSEFAHQIPDGWRICGENMYAVHSIEYHHLPSYFLAFSIFNEQNICLSWEDTLTHCSDLNLKTPGVIYQGLWDAKLISSLSFDADQVEGYVVRVAESFHFNDFSKNVAKYVRKNHVSTTDHWMHQSIKPNKLKSESDEFIL